MSNISYVRFTIINNKIDAITLLTNAEAKDSYLSECYKNEMNLIARNKSIYSPVHLSPDEYELFIIKLKY